jgi:AcrR family transcriptional regulator
MSAPARQRRKTSRDLQAEARREQLLDCAIAVLQRKGPDTSIKDIAQAAGVATGLLYHYFESKDALLQAIVRERSFAPPLERYLEDVGERSVPEVLREVAIRYHDWISKIGAIIPVLDQLALRDPEFAEFRGRVVGGQFTALARYLESRVVAGELRPHDTDLAARAMLYPIFLGWQNGRVKREFGTAIMDLLYRGLRSDGSA